MKWIGFLAVFVVAVSAQAWDFQYVETKSTWRPSSFELASIESQFRDLHFEALNKSYKGVLPYLFVDQIFAKNDGFVLVKVGLELSSAKYENQLLLHDQGAALHVRLKSGAPVALFFYHLSSNEIQNISKIFISQKETKTTLLLKTLLPSAEATETCFPTTASGLVQSGTEIFFQEMGKNMMSCAITALNQAKDQAVSFVKGTAETAKTLFTNPRKLWDDAIMKLNSMVDFVKELKPRMRELYSNLKELDSETFRKMLCGAVGSAVIGAVLSGGIAKLAVIVMERLNGLSRISKLLKAVYRSGRKSVVGEVAACVP